MNDIYIRFACLNLSDERTLDVHNSCISKLKYLENIGKDRNVIVSRNLIIILHQSIYLAFFLNSFVFHQFFQYKAQKSGLEFNQIPA